MRPLLAILVLLSAVSSAQADDKKLTAADVEALLAGNTAVGDWKGTPYRQFFAANGSTTYLAEGSEPSPGKWKVDQATGDYCSWWERSGWDCYGVEREGDGYVWVTPSQDYRGPFKVVEGRQL
ncbi:MAG: hypothetical protein MI920_37020 [Kiloniellales bacterium]|nr:hypothetical protein [Kiloniellales bacterium]